MFYSFKVRAVSGTVAQSTRVYSDPARVMRKALSTAATLGETALILLQSVTSTGNRRTVARYCFRPSSKSAQTIRHDFNEMINFIDNQYDPDWCPPFPEFVRGTLYAYTAHVMCLSDRAQRGPLLDMIAYAATLYPTALKEV